MNLVYVIIVYGLLHNVQTVLPQTYPDQQSCTAALVQTHLTFGNWGSCEPLAAHNVTPAPVVVVPPKAVLGSWWHPDRGWHRGPHWIRPRGFRTGSAPRKGKRDHCPRSR